VKLSNETIDRAMELEEEGDAVWQPQLLGSLSAQCAMALAIERRKGAYDGTYSEAVNALERQGYDLSERGAS
jgi:hypothetical protein